MYCTISEHLLPLSLSFLLWALKKVLLSGTVSAASEPERSGCLIVYPLPWGNPYKSAFLLLGVERGTEQWQGCCPELVRGIHHPGQQKTVRERQRENEGGEPLNKLQESPKPREGKPKIQGKEKGSVKLHKNIHGTKCMMLPRHSNSKEIPPPTPLSWLPLLSNVTSREWASLMSHLITAIFSGPLSYVTLQSHCTDLLTGLWHLPAPLQCSSLKPRGLPSPWLLPLPHLGQCLAQSGHSTQLSQCAGSGCR